MNSDSSVSAEDLYLAKKRYLELLQVQLQMAKAAGLAFYRPHKFQDAFHRAYKFRRRMARAGNRSGKSVAGAAEDCAWLLGERPWYPADDPARRGGIPQRPVKGIVITTDWDKVHEIFTTQHGQGGKIWQYLPQGWVKSVSRNPSGVIETIVGHNRSMICFDTVQSFKHNPLGQESSQWDFVHVDEPCPEDQWKAVSRGLIDTDGSAWFTLTPLSQMWINDMFFPRFQDEKVMGWEDDFWAIAWSIFDNPYLTPEAIRIYEQSLTDDEKECRLYGKPLELTGLVYKEFNWDKHVLKEVPHGWEDYFTPPPDWPIYYTIDPHPQTPHAVLFLTVSPQDQLFVYDEIFAQTVIEELCKMIQVKGKVTRLNRAGQKVLADRFMVRGKVDPMVSILDPITGTTIADEFARWGVWVEKASKDKALGILKVREELRRPGRLYFSPTLRRTLWEINRYCYDDENRPVDKDDHMMENLYRLLIDDPIWINRDEQSSRSIREIEITRPEFKL